jgi:hypothetical protein
MLQDAVDNARICNKGDDAHAVAAGAQKGIRLEELSDQASPRAAGFPGAIGIVPLGKLRCLQADDLFVSERRLGSSPLSRKNHIQQSGPFVK